VLIAERECIIPTNAALYSGRFDVQVQKGQLCASDWPVHLDALKRVMVFSVQDIVIGACASALRKSWSNIRNRSGYSSRLIQFWKAQTIYQCCIYDGGQMEREHHLYFPCELKSN